MADQFKFAEAFTELTVRDSQFHSSIRKATFSLQGLQRNLEAVAKHARRMLLVGGAALTGFIKLASDAEETSSKFNAVFKEGADEARAWADALAKAVGRSSFAIQEGLSSFQSFFIGMGFSADQAVELSKRMQRLSIDFASFNNIADADAMQRFISALSGSTEVLDRFGINIKANAITTQLLALGIKETATSATEMERTLARVAIIARAMGQQGAIGDAVRTAGALANQFKATKAEATALAIEIGTAFIPVMQRATTTMREWGTELSEVIKGNEGAIVTLTIFVGALTAIVAVSPRVVGAITLIGGAMKLLGGGAVAGGLVGALIVGIMALGAVWVSAAIQGKGFAEVVLDIAEAIGVLDRAQRKLNAAGTVGRLEERAGGKIGKRRPGTEDVAGARVELLQARAARTEPDRLLAAAEAELQRKQAEFDRLPEDARIRRRNFERIRLGPQRELVASRRIEAENARLREVRAGGRLANLEATEAQQEAERRANEARQKKDRDERAADVRRGEQDAQRQEREGLQRAEAFFDKRDLDQINREREREERIFAAEQDVGATDRARRLDRREPGQVAQMGVAAVQSFVQNLLNQPPRPEDVERNQLLKDLNKGLGNEGDLVKAVKAIPGAAFQ